MIRNIDALVDRMARYRYELYDSHFSMPGGMSWEQYKAEDPEGAEALYVTEMREAFLYALQLQETTVPSQSAAGEEPSPGASGSPREDAPRGDNEGTPPPRLLHDLDDVTAEFLPDDDDVDGPQ